MEENNRENKLEVRFYEKEYPEENELVMVQIKDVNEYATIVQLQEYENIEGIITPNEYTRFPKVRNLMKLRKIGKQEICMVIRVDRENGYIDLSKKRVPQQDVPEVQSRYAKGKMVQAIMRSIYEATQVPVIELYQTIVWPLQTEDTHCLDRFMQYIHKPDALFERIGEIDNKVKSKLKAEIIRRLKPQPVKVCAHFELTCFAKEGIDAIKEALRAGEACSTDEIEIHLSLIAPPLYVMAATSNRKTVCFQLFKTALTAIQEKIREKKGNFALKEKPFVVGKKTDSAMEEKLKELNKEEENEFVHDD